MSEPQSATTYKHTNRLINETSPYLLQHAHNPVDWFPWGDEALQKAKQKNKPILLSVGYSACHWCHVMERESFENEQIAALMNQYYVSIKVDREERPDIDTIYMQAVQAMTGQGGWPMTMFLTADGRPFYGGTYFPPQDRRYGQQVMPGFPRILMSLAEAFAQHRQEIEEQATEVAEHLNRRGGALAGLRKSSTGAAALLETLQAAEKPLLEDFDAQDGGFGGAPKFPNTMALEFLLRLHQHRPAGELAVETTQATQPSELEVVETSLQRMASGGIYDQLGGGFHRYSVDDIWLVPHFEKMLYDNALLSRLYLHAYLVTGKPLYRRIVEETLDYVAREMTSPEGGFYSTQDADSEGVEGKFFVWTPADVERVLGPQDAALVMRYYDVTPQGNFEGKNILHVRQDRETFARQEHLSIETLDEILERGRAALFQVREQRVRPGRDEKILTSWNGLMLRSFAEAARYLKREDYLQIAQRNASFLLETLRQDDRVLRTYKDGRARLRGYLEDYAFLADGLLALYEASFTTRWFVEARATMDQAIILFADEQQGGFFDTGTDHESLISRPKDIMDNATPAGNSVAMDVLLRLSALTGESSYRERADIYLQSLFEAAIQHPLAFGHVLGVLDFALSPVKELAVIGEIAKAETQALLDCINARYLPNSVLACAAPENQEASSAIALLADRPLKDQQSAVYICQNFACQAPVTTTQALAALF
ncbi:thioredoxin domain-containing protein [Dictyobacter arantiisoli]|uniref:Thioredoxin domain-containing protein n=1 Tax=Dictyobacter arantiisoli TaxID=2014874 RepID=A0A5A5TIL9_9CHLR|nr:thioredoxin domain-containing protein [Dictyobacter arantiisoli]GCF11450.1 thioredoxin domain-containing protein [Dictyobacter arantiisoli]